MRLRFEVNSAPTSVDVDPRDTLLSVLRDDLGLRGTKYGCGEGECGSCTVLVEGRPVTSCLTMAGQVNGQRVTTIEGIESDAVGRALVEAFAETGAVQCGFCTPGFVLTARHLLDCDPAPDRGAARRAVAGNLCRCTGYTKIIDAIVAAAECAGAARACPAGPTSDRSLAGDVFRRPTTVEEVLSLLAEPEASTLVCGSTDIGVQFEHRLKEHRFIDLTAVDAMNFVREDDDSVVIGAATPYSDVIASPAVNEWCQVLVMASREVGAEQIQNLGTLGGNIANASPAADGTPALVALGASVLIRSVAGERVIPVEEVATGPGETTLAGDELITEIVVPKRVRSGAKRVCFFEKHGPRRMQTIAVASVTCDGWLENGRLNDVRIALGAVAPTIIRAAETEAVLTSAPLSAELLREAGRTVQAECRPIDDIRGSARFRRQLVRGLLIRGLLPISRRSTR
ncbi:MAG: 2Fe-2S iron-sulfur cluster binding domain-containing protein [Acidimicrobiia bacterium]|nr:2Fe-2S iron-sulfur cluster binding domain-containing protein [Acidimicrobiia bacterium]MYC45053.1 2Fe-2S iron-sulfur cluster binding domain-containing protein [Acidimicrobiia bacterium]